MSYKFKANIQSQIESYTGDYVFPIIIYCADYYVIVHWNKKIVLQKVITFRNHVKIIELD